MNLRKHLRDYFVVATIVTMMATMIYSLYRTGSFSLTRDAMLVIIFGCLFILIMISHRSIDISSEKVRENEKIIALALNRIAFLEGGLRDSAAALESDRSKNTSWPWGEHHTEMLGHMDAAARRFWKLYDPTDPGTAPTNETVSEWLQKERGVSKDKARSIASILRADGLPTGPRK